MPQKKTTYLLTGDIGGTNSRMGLYTVDSLEVLVDRWDRNQDCLPEKADGIFECNVIAPFLKYCWEESSRKGDLVPLDGGNVEIVSCLAVAGPVANNAATMSNLHGIVIDGTAIVEQRYNKNNDRYLSCIKVCTIINDFVAQGYGCLTVKPHEVQELVPGSHSKINASGPVACVGAGTGLGECFLTPNPSERGVYSCFASEGGHVEYAPRTELEVELWRFLKEKFGYKHRISVERVVSGRGLANVYEFLAKKFPDRIVEKVHKEFKAASDMQGKVVAVNATDGSLCKQALEIMMATYGCEVGSTAIKLIPTGGLYVSGGITGKNIGYMTGANSPFMKACMDKGRVSHILENIPIFAVLVEDLGVRGAYKCAQLEYERYERNPGDKSGTVKSECDDTLFQLSVRKSLLHAAAFIGLGVAVGLLSRKKY